MDPNLTFNALARLGTFTSDLEVLVFVLVSVLWKNALLIPIEYNIHLKILRFVFHLFNKKKGKMSLWSVIILKSHLIKSHARPFCRGEALWKHPYSADHPCCYHTDQFKDIAALWWPCRKVEALWKHTYSAYHPFCYQYNQRYCSYCTIISEDRIMVHNTCGNTDKKLWPTPKSEFEKCDAILNAQRKCSHQSQKCKRSHVWGELGLETDSL